MAADAAVAGRRRYADQTGGRRRRKHVPGRDLDRRGEFTRQLQRLAIHAGAADALGAIFIRLAEANGLVERAALLRVFYQEILVDRFGRRRRQALLLGLRGGRRQQACRCRRTAATSFQSFGVHWTTALGFAHLDLQAVDGRWRSAGQHLSGVRKSRRTALLVS